MAAGRRRIAAGIVAAVVAAGAVAAVLAIRGGGSDAPPGRATGDGSGAMAGRGDGSTGAGAAAGSESAGGLVATARAEAAAGHYVQALGLYQRAHALDPAPSTLLEVGRMQHLSGRCREAHRTTQRVLAASPPGDIAAAAQELVTRIGRCD
jgi:hypothetical protein